MTDEVVVEVRDGVQTLRINRPEKKNALIASMYNRMIEAVESGDASADVAAHVFLGCNGVFTAGNDINDFVQRDGAADPDKGASGFIRMLPKVKKPMIAAVDGLAVGIGTTMLFHCDLVYAAPSASFRTPFLDLGVVPEAGSSLLGPMRMSDTIFGAFEQVRGSPRAPRSRRAARGRPPARIATPGPARRTRGRRDESGCATGDETARRARRSTQTAARRSVRSLCADR